MTYSVQDHLKPSDLSGISPEQIDQHWKLYEGYVGQVNSLRKELDDLRKDGKGGSANYADRRRRYGFEYCGMVLHEYYFGNLKKGTDSDNASAFKKAVENTWGSFEAWQEDFVNTGKTRSIGWAICALDPETGCLTNHFIQLHEEGNVPGFHPVLVMDVWEHAYMVDHAASGRGDYINAFFENVNWDVVESRYTDSEDNKASKRF